MENKIEKIRNIEVGRFYLVHDGSSKGHPGFIIWKDDLANLFFLVKFGSTSNNDNIVFPHSLSKNIDNTFVYKRPYLAKRKDIGKEWFYDYGFVNADIEVLNEVLNNNPVFSKNIRRKDRRYFSLVKKRNQIKTVI